MQETIDYISTKFSAERTATYRLSIQHSLSGYSFCVTDADGICVGIKHITASYNQRTIEGLTTQEPWLQLPYSEIIYYGIGPYSAVPQPMLRDGNGAEYLAIEPHLRQRAKIRQNIIGGDTSIVAYTNQWVIKDEWQLHHRVELLARQALSSQKRSGIWADTEAGMTHMIVKQEQKLKLINSFTTENIEDICYYILAAYENMRLSHEDIATELSGEKANEARDFLVRYVRQVEQTKPSNWSSDFGEEYKTIFALMINNAEQL